MVIEESNPSHDLSHLDTELEKYGILMFQVSSAWIPTVYPLSETLLLIVLYCIVYFILSSDEHMNKVKINYKKALIQIISQFIC